MDELKKILSNDATPLSNEQLSDYIKGNLSDEAAHKIEENFDEEDPFLQDAIDGLKETKIDIDLTIYEINNKINKKLKLSNKKEKRILKNQSTSVFAIGLILFLIIVGYIVIKLFLKKSS